MGEKRVRVRRAVRIAVAPSISDDLVVGSSGGHSSVDLFLGASDGAVGAGTSLGGGGTEDEDEEGGGGAGGGELHDDVGDGGGCCGIL